MDAKSKRAVLQEADFGRRVAEDEAEQLAAYFVETEQWRRILNGDVDVVQGAKGAGKSAIYSLLLSRQSDLLDRNTLLVPAENPRGATVFRDLIADPPASELESQTFGNSTLHRWSRKSWPRGESRMHRVGRPRTHSQLPGSCPTSR